MSAVQLAYAVPADGLSRYFSLFYDFSADVASFEDTERADRAQLRLRLSAGTSEYRFADGRVQRAPAFHIVGPTAGAFHVRADGPVEVFGAGITPAGWASLVGIDASAMLNRVIDATELLALRPGRVRAAAAALAARRGIEARAAVAAPMLHSLLGRGDRVPGAFVAQVDAWLADHPSPDVAELVRTCGLSRRQVERRCNALYGIPPKLLARKYRALRAAVALVANHEPLDDLIARGFYDQSHLIRELKQFTGSTPRQMLSHPGLLARLSIAQRRALSGRVDPLISET